MHVILLHRFECISVAPDSGSRCAAAGAPRAAHSIRRAASHPRGASRPRLPWRRGAAGSPANLTLPKRAAQQIKARRPPVTVRNASATGVFARLRARRPDFRAVRRHRVVPFRYFPNTLLSAAADTSMAWPAASRTPPIVIKPWIMPSKQRYSVSTPAALSLSA